MKLKISGIIKKRVSQIIDIPFEKEVVISDDLFDRKEDKKKFIKRVKNKFPKGSIINIEVLK